jgi:hypothetical protein
LTQRFFKGPKCTLDTQASFSAVWRDFWIQNPNQVDRRSEKYEIPMRKHKSNPQIEKRLKKVKNCTGGIQYSP